MENENATLFDTLTRDVGKISTDDLKLKGHFSIDHMRNGKVIDHREIDNVITDAGRAAVAQRINASATAAFTYIAIGIGTGAAVVGDVALGSEITTFGGARASATCSNVTTSVALDTAQMVLLFTFTSGASFAVTESGVFNAASGVTLLCRQTFSAINVTNGDTLQITWKVKVA